MAEKERIFITGINGNIGRVLQQGLAAQYDVWGLDVDGPFSQQVVEGDIRHYDSTIEAMRKAAPFAYLVHLAADAHADAEWESVLPLNIEGTEHVFRAARELGVQRVIFASSNHVTGAYDSFPPDLYLHKLPDPRRVTVDDPIRPDGYYGVSKAFGEALARYYAARYDITFICLRIGVVLEDDDPTGNPWFKKSWLSHRDLIQLVRRSLESNVVFGIYYGMSDNRGGFWDISNARYDLGYDPQDDAADYGQPK